MSIRTISTGQLRRMGDQEGLVLQGCGGDPQEWVDGINEILAQEDRHKFRDRCPECRKKSKPYGRYSSLTAGTVPAVSIMNGA